MLEGLHPNRPTHIMRLTTDERSARAMTDLIGEIFDPAETAVASTLAPAYRPSSVPVTRTMHIDSNGVAAAGIALGLAAAARSARPGSKLWLIPALAAPAIAAFFRDPERDVPTDPRAVVAASDGRVLSVEHDPRKVEAWRRNVA